MAREVDLSLLRAFVAVAETGGMTVAGRHLNLTQAAVSQQIKRLEEHFGVALFDRSQRRLQLTASGERLIGHAERLLAANDELWGLMTSPDFEGQVRLGVPHDIVVPFLPPVLRAFSKCWPRVDVTLTCRNSPELRHQLAQGNLDLTLTTEAEAGPDCEVLCGDRLVWVGAEGGSAHEKSPLPVSLGDEKCAFRNAAVEALTKSGRDWRFTTASSNMEAQCATLEADLAISPFLSLTVPERFAILGPESGLPALPTFFVNLYLAPTKPSPIAIELARQISKDFAARFPQAA